MRDRTFAAIRSPFFWLGLSLLAALAGALFFSDGLAGLARASATYQRQIQVLLTTSLKDIGTGSSSAALWVLISVCFSYGVVHTLGPGHGKAVIVAYFLDGGKPRAWIDGILAGGWIAITHTLSALMLAVTLKLLSVVGLFGALAHARLVEIVSYVLILAVGFWRLRAGLRGDDHACDHDHDHDHAHAHGRDRLHRDHPGVAAVGFLRRRSGLLLLSAAGVAPCAGALILVLLALALDVLWAGVIGVLAIAVGMTAALAAIGMASMLAHRLIIGDGQSSELGRLVAVGSSLVVIATASILLLGAVSRQMGWVA